MQNKIFHSLNARDLTKFFNVDRAKTWSYGAGATTLRNPLAKSKMEQYDHQKAKQVRLHGYPDV
jgi:hypothetical protein